MAHFLRKCKGFVGFDIIGEAPERLYNLLVDNGVDVWSFRRRKDVLSGCMECRDYLKIRPLCRKVGVKTRVTGRYGLPFFLKKRIGIKKIIMYQSDSYVDHHGSFGSHAKSLG